MDHLIEAIETLKKEIQDMQASVKAITAHIMGVSVDFPHLERFYLLKEQLEEDTNKLEEELKEELKSLQIK
jgi:uncharacterized protein (UPF0335 family)